MMAEYNLALHEVLDLHEIMGAKTLCATKAQAMVNVVQDRALKALIDTDLRDTKQQINELQALLQSNIQ